MLLPKLRREGWNKVREVLSLREKSRKHMRLGGPLALVKRPNQFITREPVKAGAFSSQYQGTAVCKLEDLGR